MKNDDVCPFCHIRLNVPQKFIRKVYHRKGPLSHQEHIKIRRKIDEIEHAQNMIAHYRSIVEKVLLKSYQITP